MKAVACLRVIFVVFFLSLSATYSAQGGNNSLKKSSCSGDLIGLTPPSLRFSAMELATGVYLKSDLIVGLPAQARVKVPPTLQLKHPETRVESIREVTINGETLILTTSENDAAFRIFDTNGKLIKKLQHLHSQDGSGWSGMIVAVDSECGVALSDGGATPIRVVDLVTKKKGQNLRFAKPRSRASKKFQENKLVEFLGRDRELLIVSEDGSYNLWRQNVKTRDFELIAKGLFLIPTITGYDDLNLPIQAAKLSPDRKTIWVHFSDGKTLEYPLQDLSEKGGENSERNLIPSKSFYLPGDEVSAMSFSPDGKQIVFAVAQYSFQRIDSTWVRDDVPEKTSLVSYDTESLTQHFFLEGIIFGSHVTDLRVTSSRIVVVSSDPESAVLFFDRDGNPGPKWVMQRDPKKHYLSQLSGPHDPIHSSTLSEDEQFLVTGHDGGSLAIWELDRGLIRAVTQIDEGDIRGLSFSADSRSILVGAHMGLAQKFSLSQLLEDAKIQKKQPKLSSKPTRQLEDLHSNDSDTDTVRF